MENKRKSVSVLPASRLKVVSAPLPLPPEEPLPAPQASPLTPPPMPPLPLLPARSGKAACKNARNPCERKASRSRGEYGLSVPEAGAMIGLGRNASYEAAKRGEIPTLEIGALKIVPRIPWLKQSARRTLRRAAFSDGNRQS